MFYAKAVNLGDIVITIQLLTFGTSDYVRFVILSANLAGQIKVTTCFIFYLYLIS